MKPKALFSLVVGICFFACMGLVGPVFADEPLTDAKILSLGPEEGAKSLGPVDASTTPKLSFKSTYLSSVQFGTSKQKISSVRPGEYIYGVYDVKLAGQSTNLDRYYSIDKYSYNTGFSSVYNVGLMQFSWGWQIPANIAKNNDKPVLFAQFSATNGNTIKKSMSFSVKRDGISNSNRAYMNPMDKVLKAQIINNCKAVDTDLKKTSSLKFNSHYQSNSASATAFLKNLKSWRPNAVLIHSHGSGDTILLKDESYIDATSLAASGFTAPAGLFYAAVCEGALTSALGDAFVAAGYNAFIGYTVSVYTTRNADFYKYFFDLAVQPDVSVATALSDTIAWANGQGWDDVATATIIGDGSAVYLGGTTGDGASEKETTVTTEKTALQVEKWKPFVAAEATVAMKNAVMEADEIEEVKNLKEEYGADLVTGVQTFPNVYRVSYKLKNVYYYGVDVDKTTGKVVYQGTMD